MALSSQLEQAAQTHEQNLQRALMFDKNCSIIAQGYSHKDALSSLFTSVPGVHPEEDLSLKRTSVARIHAFIDRGITFRRPLGPCEQAAGVTDPGNLSMAPYSGYRLNAAVPLLTLPWPPGLEQDVADLMRRYVQEGYFPLNGPFTGSWDTLKRDDLSADSALEHAIEFGCTEAMLALIELGAEVEQVPAKPRVVSALNRIEAGDIMGFVSFTHGDSSRQASAVRSALMQRVISAADLHSTVEEGTQARTRRARSRV